MIYYVVALWSAAAVLLFNQPRSEVNRWAAFFLWSAGIGGLTDLLAPSGFIPVRYEPWIQVLNHTLTPYGVLIFCMVYTRRPQHHKRKRDFKLGLFLPVLAMLAQVLLTEDYRIHYGWLFVWTVPYYVAACALLIRALSQEMNPQKRKSMWITTWIMVPTLLGVMLLINVGNLISPGYDSFRYVSLFILYSMGVAVICTFVYGVLGVRLKFERDPLDRTMQAVSSGTSMLNHTIKNEIGKIAMSTENVKRLLPQDKGVAIEQLEVIANSSEHLLAMVGRMQQQMKAFKLVEQPVRVDQLLAKLQLREQDLLRRHGVELMVICRQRPWLLADTVHLKEAISNLIRNSVEAMPDGGVITLTVMADRKGAAISVKDNGIGIPRAQQALVFEPFYSTKGHKKDNFGLGLSYVYNVMKKSGGSVGLESRESVGTEITLYFPRSKIIRLSGREEA
ncbi:sensor histidine kinase [Paenibacillus sp. ISL-20]|uniref:sensor histidine kinase n=1 Tax=Paenibacillus sp. ISL-20 TaxID=2819163 RepID=UPI001BECBEC4|nr:sensor histidine kinase [Paenibacillus sp. ISL-20]MBT2759733.1 histidine kinase [Paenibacillus sp. ISL-20]